MATRNPENSPVDMVNIPLFTVYIPGGAGFLPSTVKCKTRWWFQIFFIFTPKLGEDFQFD